MFERYRAKSPRQEIAQAIEAKAGKEFGERLPRSEIARCLNLPAEAISDEEWHDISEFAVNAGASLMRTAAQHEILLPTKTSVIKNRIWGNAYGLAPYHDLFHAAEKYRETGGKEASASFAAAGPRERYTDPEGLAAELYPVLFFAGPGYGAPLPVTLGTPEMRKWLLRVVREGSEPWQRETLSKILEAELPSSATERQVQYEEYLSGLLMGSARKRVHLTQAELSSMEEGYARARANPPAAYARFAPRVFAEEWKDNPRLFLDELLECVRTKPETAGEQ